MKMNLSICISFSSSSYLSYFLTLSLPVSLLLSLSSFSLLVFSLSFLSATIFLQFLSSFLFFLSCFYQSLLFSPLLLNYFPSCSILFFSILFYFSLFISLNLSSSIFSLLFSSLFFSSKGYGPALWWRENNGGTWIALQYTQVPYIFFYNFQECNFFTH